VQHAIYHGGQIAMVLSMVKENSRKKAQTEVFATYLLFSAETMREGGTGRPIAPGHGQLGMANWSAGWAERGRRAQHDEIVGIGPFVVSSPGDQGDGRAAGDPCWLAGAVIATLDAFV